MLSIVASYYKLYYSNFGEFLMTGLTNSTLVNQSQLLQGNLSAPQETNRTENFTILFPQEYGDVPLIFVSSCINL